MLPVTRSRIGTSLITVGFLVAFWGIQCPAGAGPATRAYQLRPGDVLQITVAGHPELSFDSSNPIEIRPDGKFSYPFGSEIVAEGKAVEEVSATLVAALRRHLRDPQVAINVIRYREEEIYLVGELNKPGAYPLPQDRNLGVREALALAEGLRPTASREAARLFRTGQAPQLIDLRKLLAGTSDEILLEPGDTLVIPSRNVVSVLGAVASPGSYQLPDEGKVSDALAAAGGFTVDPETGGTRANRVEAVLIRADRTTVPVNLAAILSGYQPQADLRMYTGDSLLILEAKNQVAVLGEVGEPGSYYLADEEKLSTVLAMAGGTTKAADLQHLRIIGADGRLRSVNYEPLLREGAEAPPVLCRAGDTVIVPVNRRRIAVLGAVNRPGVYTIQTGDTLLDIISQAGGAIMGKSVPEHTALIRAGTEEGEPLRLNLRDLSSVGSEAEALLAQDGDVIFMPESKRLDWRDWTSIVSSLASLVWIFN